MILQCVSQCQPFQGFHCFGYHGTDVVAAREVASRELPEGDRNFAEIHPRQLEHLPLEIGRDRRAARILVSACSGQQRTCGPIVAIASRPMPFSPSIGRTGWLGSTCGRASLAEPILLSVPKVSHRCSKSSRVIPRPSSRRQTGRRRGSSQRRRFAHMHHARS